MLKPQILSTEMADAPTAEQWQKWLSYKSNKERWIEAQERLAEESDEENG